ncbi:MAG: PD-(D/E)XK nuclease family protein [Gaiellales bacterium]
MPLTIVLGPANCGKVANLLERFLEALGDGRQPYLVVPTIPDVELAERDLLRNQAVLLGSRIGTFDDLFAVVLERCGEPAEALAPLERRIVLEQVVEQAQLDALAAAARFPGFVDGLGRLFDDLASAAPPSEVGRRLAAWDAAGRRGEIAALHAAYMARLAELGRLDRTATRGRAAELLDSRLDAWDGAPVLAYGFEDVSGVQLAALRSLAARCQVTVSLPYETGRPAFDAVRPVVDALTAIPHELIELPPASHFHSPLLAHLERALFEPGAPQPAPEADGSVVLLEACGVRGVADQVAVEALNLIRGGTPADEIAVLARDVQPWRIALETAFVSHGVPLEVDAQVDLGGTAFGQAMLGLLRFAWFQGDRGELFRFLRSPFSGIPRVEVDRAEGRLRGRGALAHEDVRSTLEELEYGRLLAAAERLAQSSEPLDQVADLVRRMSAACAGLTAGVLSPAGERHAAALRAVLRALEELRRMAAAGAASLDRGVVLAALDRVTLRTGGGPAPGRVAALDLRRARTRRFQAVFVLGLEEGSLPGGPRENPYLTSEEAAELGITRLDPGHRDRHLFYMAATRPWTRLYLSRQAADDEGRVREPSPFLDDVRSALGDAAGSLERRRRELGDLTWELEQAPTERERLRALARELRRRGEWAAALAEEHGWGRKMVRAQAAYRRSRRLQNPAVLAALAAQERFSVTELEKFAECSSAWFVERFLNPGEIDYEFGPKEAGSVAHTTLHRFYDRLPGELGVERLSPADLPRAVPLMRRCLEESLATARVPSSAAGKEAVRRLELDLEGFLRAEAAFPSPLVPREFEVRFGTKSSPPNLQAGLQLDGFAVSGTIDRIDRDPALSARGAVWDYKLGKGAKSAARIESERRLQLPLYILVLRDLLGIEPIAGLYRALGGQRLVRGMAVRGELPGVTATDQLATEEFWSQVDRAVGYANEIVGRIRSGDVRLDPIAGRCPEWCLRQAGGVCRVERA